MENGHKVKMNCDIYKVYTPHGDEITYCDVIHAGLSYLCSESESLKIIDFLNFWEQNENIINYATHDFSLTKSLFCH